MAAWLSVLAVLFISSAAATDEHQSTPEQLSITSRPIEDFQIGSSKKRFGALAYVGGLEMNAEDWRFSGLSSFRFLSPGDRFIGVTDTGFWYIGRLERDEEGRPSGVTNFVTARIPNADGETEHDKWLVDAEAVAVRGDEVVIGFEREHRLAVFALVPTRVGPVKKELDFLVPEYELRDNKGFETLAFAPEDGALAGALLAVSERSLDRQGNIFAAILSGPREGVFSIARRDEFDITDGAFLPNGDLLILERRFSLLQGGITMRLRRISEDSLEPGALAEGIVLMQAHMGHQIDNMEGLDVWENAAGQTMISLMSDDNHSFLQRNLYLEFRLVSDRSARWSG